tara:strand:+ start:51 stop:569 length:519 start_codon:yes stop_codon:yes gene_type:complete
MSTLQVDTINTVSGTPFISAQQFRLAANQAGSGSAGTVFTNWEEVDTDYQAIGSAWSQSSGVFSCSVTGVYMCSWVVVINGSADDRYDPSVEISVNSGGAYSTRSLAWGHSEPTHPLDNTLGNTFLFDVSNASAFRLQFKQSTTNDINGSTTIVGNSSYSATQITFIRLGAT